MIGRAYFWTGVGREYSANCDGVTSHTSKRTWLYLNVALNDLREFALTERHNVLGTAFTSSFHRNIIILLKVDASVGVPKQFPTRTTMDQHTQNK